MFSSRHQGRGAVTVTTALATAALLAGMTGTTAVAHTAASTASTTGTGPGLRWVTLITGDRVGLDGRDRVVSVERGEGRESTAVRSWTERGRTYAVPVDAERLIARGTLDRRLFDVTRLAGPESRRAYRDGLKVIVQYAGASAAGARKGIRADAKVARTLPSINADAVTVPRRDPGGLWSTLTGTGARAGGAGARTAGTAPGIERVWLDAVYTPNLDTSVGRIGAPKAWQSGYDGTGVTVAVLDSGVDDTHPDLATRVVGAANFSSSPDTKDRNGHGTHIASTIAGTGAKSGGRYRGVAPGADILNGKVMGDHGSMESGAIAAVDWAVGRGADIVSMSFGSGDEPEINPLEAHINRVTKEKGVLFTVSAGNEGPNPGSVGSPGSAEAALTVGAVDDADRVAPFSSVGPLHDGSVKPDVTAPGVGITAASAPGSTIAEQVGENPPGYFTIGGTSMAAPHVAGAAALLKQRHPGWTGERLKAALTASAQDGGNSVLQQGTGRVAVDRALEQTVVTDETTVSFGRQQWPHTDDRPVTRQLTYRNLGTQPITLDLAVKGLDARGGPAPAGFFTLGADKVTVPAGATTTVPFTADTRTGGDNDGLYTAVVTATGGGQTVRSTAAVDREVESYDLTLDFVGRDGQPGTDFYTHLLQLSGAGDISETLNGSATGTERLRLPKGDYALFASQSNPSGGSDRLVHPRLELTKNTALTIDARTTKPVEMTVSDPRARMTGAAAAVSVAIGDRSMEFGDHFATTFEGFRTAQLGPEQPTGVRLRDSLYAQWERDASVQYSLAAGGEVNRLFTGYTRKFGPADYARATVVLGASAQGRTGRTTALGGKERFAFGSEHAFALPGSRTHYLATDGKAALWSLSGAQLDPQGGEEIEYTTPEREFRPGTSHRLTLGTAVHSPLMQGRNGVFRKGNRLEFVVPLFSDGRGNVARSAYSSARTTLHQGTTMIAEKADPLMGWEFYAVGAEDAEYTLATSVTRSRDISAVGTRVDASWTFRSAKPPTDTETRTALSTVRFGAQVNVDGTVPADRTATFPVTVQGPAAGTGLKSLRVAVSYDGGTTWQPTSVDQGRITVKNPAKGKSLALRGEVADTSGGTASVTVHDAYIGG
ncbi:S8 family serine peptidase [Streptomyces clavuligerus]|uniref:S8 family serine peptidase n=1 Tax=Streptomyces clavuligerus TaxID=1901 RepID=UPI00017FF113|nr:S8 family serine peptidase [Streptomyces clavuligerus]EDY47192.1 1,4-dihydropyridine enentioselective esterase [Streptomyces clavuligerus]MBY6306698.1 S8 family serine peptidase [Streptomyces clavuligerus]QCS10695.1 peptidase S8 [Streptomyces clavuligerus]QPJ97268.1 S8 family serine peptidase [Streptomyces clavuligerus]WDN57407.1 S8 family serine peptidase [Streptomyces clavuligerus]